MISSDDKVMIGIKVDVPFGTRPDADDPSLPLNPAYVAAIQQAGGNVVIIPNFPDTENDRNISIKKWLDYVDGLIVPGGDFALPPEWYVGGDQSPYPMASRLKNDIDITMASLALNMPYLGICAGMQMLACLYGCKMTGNVHKYYDTSIRHRGNQHKISIVEGSVLEKSIKVPFYEVVSEHNEAVVEASPQVLVSARAPDGVIEAVEVLGKTFALGVEWHPERGSSDPDKALFKAYVEACKKFKAVRSMTP